MKVTFKHNTVLLVVLISSFVNSQDCNDCTIYNAALGCYAVDVCDDPNATNYCEADFYINSGPVTEPSLTEFANTKKFLMMILVGILPTQDLMQPLLSLMQIFCLMKRYYRAEH